LLVNGKIGKSNKFIAVRDTALVGEHKRSCDGIGHLTRSSYSASFKDGVETALEIVDLGRLKHRDTGNVPHGSFLSV